MIYNEHLQTVKKLQKGGLMNTTGYNLEEYLNSKGKFSHLTTNELNALMNKTRTPDAELNDEYQKRIKLAKWNSLSDFDKQQINSAFRDKMKSRKENINSDSVDFQRDPAFDYFINKDINASSYGNPSNIPSYAAPVDNTEVVL